MRLKPCPFCGGKARVMKMGFPHWIYCEECGAKIHAGTTDERDSMRAWNKRAITEPAIVPVAEIKFDKDELKELVDKAVLAVTPQEQRWIPVSEKLPEESYYCLCCNKDGYITIGSISRWTKKWCFEDDDIDIDVVAWMPLPEPYRDGKSDALDK